MKIAVTSQNLRTITGHAGKGRRFLIYEAKGERFVRTGELDLPKEMAMHGYPAGEPHPLDEMDALVTASCGGGFVSRMSDRDVQVFVTEEKDPSVAVGRLAAKLNA